MNAENKRSKIMIVDDDAGLLEELSSVIDDAGYETVTFTQGQKAIDEAVKSPPDLILLDLQLDGKSGFLVATELTRSRRTSNIPILGITGQYSGKLYADLMNIIGFRGCLLKPLDPDRLLSEIGDILSRN